MVKSPIAKIFMTFTVVLLEFLRILFIFLFLGILGWELIENIYTLNETTTKYQGIAGIGIYVILFVLYRNKFQFSGWYKGEGVKKLPKPATITLVSIAVLLLAAPFGISFWEFVWD